MGNGTASHKTQRKTTGAGRGHKTKQTGAGTRGARRKTTARKRAAKKAERVTLEAALDVVSAEALRTRLLKTQNSSEPLTVDASGVQQVSTAALQVLAAFVRDMHQQSGEVVWADPSGPLIESARCLGLREHLGLPSADA